MTKIPTSDIIEIMQDLIDKRFIEVVEPDELDPNNSKMELTEKGLKMFQMLVFVTNFKQL